MKTTYSINLTVFSGDSGGMTNLWLFRVRVEIGHFCTRWRYPVPSPIDEYKIEKISLNELQCHKIHYRSQSISVSKFSHVHHPRHQARQAWYQRAVALPGAAQLPASDGRTWYEASVDKWKQGTYKNKSVTAIQTIVAICLITFIEIFMNTHDITDDKVNNWPWYAVSPAVQKGKCGTVSWLLTKERKKGIFLDFMLMISHMYSAHSLRIFKR